LLTPHGLAWKQLRKEKLRLAVAVAGVAFAVVLMLMQLGFYDVVIVANTKLHSHLVTDLVVEHTNAYAIQFVRPFPRAFLYQALGDPGVASVAPLCLGVARWRNPFGTNIRTVWVLGFHPDDRVLSLPGLDAQRGLLKIPDRVLFDALSRPEYGAVAEVFRRGQQVSTEVSGHRVTVVGLFDFGATFSADGNLITSDETFRRIFRGSPDEIQLGLVRLAAGADVERVRRHLVAMLPPTVKVLTKPEFIESEIRFWQEGTAVGFIFAFGAIMGFVVGAVVVYQILFSDVSDHLAEYATLKAMGYADLYISGVVVSEAVILALVGFVPGLGLSAWLFELCRNATQLPMQLTPRLLLIVLGLTLLMCSLSGLAAVNKVRRADPADVF
jgi:DevC protein